MSGLVGEQEGFVVDTELNWEPAKVEEVPTELCCDREPWWREFWTYWTPDRTPLH